MEKRPLVERIRDLLPVIVFISLMAAILSYSFIVRPWYLNWGSTAEEKIRHLPGDYVVPGVVPQGTRSITIRAPQEKVWPWLAQLGQDRGGFYSYSWLENLVLSDIHNTDRINPEWQERRAGDFIRSVKRGYFFGLLPDRPGYSGWTVPLIRPNEAMTLEKWGTFVLERYDSQVTRFHARTMGGPMNPAARLFTFYVMDAAHFVMEKRMMLEIKRLAEERPGTPGWLKAAATFGFIIAALGAAARIASRKRKWPWLFLPIAYALWIFVETSDGRSALVGFTALALAVLGFMLFRGRWWMFFGPLWILTYAVLFLANDAYPVFGFLFLGAAAVISAVAIFRRRGGPALEGPAR